MFFVFRRMLGGMPVPCRVEHVFSVRRSEVEPAASHGLAAIPAGRLGLCSPESDTGSRLVVTGESAVNYLSFGHIKFVCKRKTVPASMKRDRFDRVGDALD